jgi:hypothetical protein
MARRGMWLIGGVAVGLGALVLKPDGRTWLRRRLGMEPEDRRWFEEDDSQPAEHEGDEPLDTREARFSLRARLAEEGHAEPAATMRPLAAAPPPPPVPPLTSVEQAPAPLAPAFGSAPPVAPAPEPPAEAEPALDEPAADVPATDEFAVAEAAVAEPAVAEEGAVAEAVVEPAPEEPAAEEPAAETPAAADPIPASERPWAAPAAVPEPPPAAAPVLAFESVPSIVPEDDAPMTPGEDTSEIEEPEETPYLTFQAPAVVPMPTAEDDAPPPPPPTPLRPPTAPASRSPSRPFGGESTSFRSAIDAARERVHGAAREATPDAGESTEPLEDRD